jgi:uncharacterized membrane protein YphA (DoxX/SURF4 family)
MNEAAVEFRMSPPEIILRAIQVGLGVVFVWAAGNKLFVSGVEVFMKDVANFRIVGEPWDAVIAYSLPWLELIVGLCLILHIQQRGAALLATLMTVVFLGAIISAWMRGIDLHCGCFGKSTEAVKYPQKITQLVLQLGACAVALWRVMKPSKYEEN